MRGAGRAKRYSARAPSWLIDHGTSSSSSIACTPSVNAVASSVMCANASAVSTSPRVARIAAVDSALPASVPPTPPTSMMSASPASVWPVIAAATSSVMP